MYHRMTGVDAPNCTLADKAIQTLAGINYSKNCEESIYLINSCHRGLNEEEESITQAAVPLLRADLATIFIDCNLVDTNIRNSSYLRFSAFTGTWETWETLSRATTGWLTLSSVMLWLASRENTRSLARPWW